MRSWLDKKAQTEGNPWKTLISNPEVIKIAHRQAAPINTKYVSLMFIEDFKDFLLHLLVFSILWAHFSNADNWELGNDVGNKQLNFAEFKLACTTLNEGEGSQKILTDEQIQKDFEVLDVNKDNAVDFVEVR